MAYSNTLVYEILMDLARVILIGVAIVMSLRIVWRSEQHLDRFFKHIAAGLAFFMIGTILDIIEYMGIPDVRVWIPPLNVIGMLLFISALASMNKFVNKVGNDR